MYQYFSDLVKMHIKLQKTFQVKNEAKEWRNNKKAIRRKHKTFGVGYWNKKAHGLKNGGVIV